MSYRLSIDARIDVDELFIFSMNRFGERQTMKYMDDLEDMLNSIGQNPLIGRNRPEIKHGLMSFSFRSHVIFYRQQTNGDAFVLRILHSSRDPLALLN